MATPHHFYPKREVPFRALESLFWEHLIFRSLTPPPPKKKIQVPLKMAFSKKEKKPFLYKKKKWRLISYFKFCLFKINLFFQKLMKVAFSKTSSFQNKIFLHKNVFFPNLSFKNKLRLKFFKKKKKIFSNLLKHCWLKTFLRIAYLGICAYDSIPLKPQAPIKLTWSLSFPWH